MEMRTAEKGDLPCGVVNISGEGKPTVSFINREMLMFLSVNDEQSRWAEFIKENYLLAIPANERTRFTAYVKKAVGDGAPFRIRHKMVDANGKEVRFTGWMQGVMLENGEKEVRIVYSPPGFVEAELSRQEKVYREALKRYYDVIFEVDLDREIVDCMHSKDVKYYGFMPIVRYTYEGAFEYLISSYIFEDDREMVHRFKDKVLRKGECLDADVKSARFRIKHREYPVRVMECDVLGIDEMRCLICFRDVTEDEAPESEGEALRGDRRVVIRTKGTFDVFADGKPIAFRNEKSKELLQIMVAKNGGYVGAVHAIRLLWPDEESTKTVQSRYRQTALRLNNILKEYGIEDIVENKAGQRRIVPEKVIIES